MSYPNVTVTEWSVAGKVTSTAFEVWEPFFAPSGVSVNNNLDRTSHDKGSQDSLSTLRELQSHSNSYELILNIFRRNIALRANRVLHPARNAQIFSSLINLMISNGAWMNARDVVAYIELPTSTYLTTEADSERRKCYVDANTTAYYICKSMLELDLDRMAWINLGRRADCEPSTPKSTGDATQEWLYTQVYRSDLGFRVADMLLAVLRLALYVSYFDLKSDFNGNIEVIYAIQIDKLFT